MWLLMIILHAISGIVSFIAGCFLVFKQKQTTTNLLFNVYFYSMVLLVIFMVGAIVAGWLKHTASERIIFPGLVVLGIYMLYRALKAKEVLKKKKNNWQRPFIDHVGFNVISLFEGFVIVTAIDLGVPGFVVAIIAIFGVILGSRAVAIAKSKAV